jgi:hypothetical protein
LPSPACRCSAGMPVACPSARLFTASREHYGKDR